MKPQRSNAYVFWRAVAHVAILIAITWPIAFLVGFWLDLVFN